MWRPADYLITIPTPPPDDPGGVAAGLFRRVWRTSLDQPGFAPYSGGEISPGPAVETDTEILDWVARDAETALHPSCTAKMGIDDLAVVDPATMRVRDVDGLRVVDAAVMPSITRAPTNLTTIAIAERAVEFLP